MSEITDKNFGLLIAYVLPGFALLLVLSERIPTIRSWLGAAPTDSPSVGGFLYVTMASVAAGMTLSAVRWLILDTIHHRSGIQPPAWDFSTLQNRLSAFQGAVENHYRHYQFFGAMAVAGMAAVLMPAGIASLTRLSTLVVSLGMSLLTTLFFVASRDALQKYYSRTSLILGIRNISQKGKRNDKRMA